MSAFEQTSAWPVIRAAGFDGYLVSFADALGDSANRAALAFARAVEDAQLCGVLECSSSLVSTYVRFDPLTYAHAALRADLEELLASQDWYDVALPEGRRLWHVPTRYDGPHLADVAEQAGLTVSAAVAQLSTARVRVQALGFVAGMPYLGALPEAFDVPRLQGLVPEVPVGALCVAIRQFVVFPVAAPTGWRQVGQTGLALFQPDAEEPFLLRPGDEVVFEAAAVPAAPRRELIA